MYFLKTQGTDKVTDFIEIRDNNFALIDFIKLSEIEKKLPSLLEKYNISSSIKDIIEKINKTDFGKIEKFD